MFDIAWSELMLIALVALIFIGPKELPHVLYGLGRALSKLRRAADDFKRQFEESMREAGYDDLHRNFEDLRHLNPANQIRNSIDRALNQGYPPATTTPYVEPTAAAGSPGGAAGAAPSADVTPDQAASKQADHVKDAKHANGVAVASGDDHRTVQAG